MSWLSKLLKKSPNNVTFAPSLDGFAPIFSQFGTDIYASDVVQQALKCIVDEVKKLNPTHVRYKNNDPTPVKSDIQNALNDPNPFMTTSEFLEKVTWLLLLNYNAFVVPIFRKWIDPKTKVEKRYCEALYPIKPAEVFFIQDASGKLFVKFMFLNGFTTTLLYDDVIHIKYNYSVNQFMGGDEMGQPDHKAVLETLELNKTLLQGVAKAMKASYAINGVVKYNTMLDDGKTVAALRELESKLKNNESGFLPLDIKADFTPLEKSVALVDKPTLEFVDSKILRNWGVPLNILTGDFTKSQYNAFYQKTLEPLIIQFGQALTKKLFTPREKDLGNRIELYPKELVFMTVEQTIEMVTLLANTGALYENEKRVAFGLRPLPELEGKRFMSLNWIDANNASQYQVGKDNVNIDVVDEEKEEV